MNRERGTLHVVCGGATFDYRAQQQIVIILLPTQWEEKLCRITSGRQLNMMTSCKRLLLITFIHRLLNRSYSMYETLATWKTCPSVLKYASALFNTCLESIRNINSRTDKYRKQEIEDAKVRLIILIQFIQCNINLIQKCWWHSDKIFNTCNDKVFAHSVFIYL